jgi:hypothetical protein
MRKTISDRLFIFRNNWKARLQELNTPQPKKRQKSIWMGFFKLVEGFGRMFQPVAVMLLAIFVLYIYSYMYAGEKIPELTIGTTLMVMGYPMAWLMQILGYMGKSVVEVLSTPDYEQDRPDFEAARRNWDQIERDLDEDYL